MFEEFIQSPAGRAIAAVVISALAILIIDLNYRWFFKRVFDIVFSLIAILICSPLFFAGVIISAVRGDEITEKTPYLGKGGKIVFLRSFAGMEKGIKNLPRLIDILCGNMSFAGVAPMALSDGAFMDDNAMERFTARPAVFNHLALRADENMTYEEMFALDARYAKRRELFTDIFIVIKSLVLAIRGERKSYLGEVKDGTYAQTLLKRGEITEEDILNAEKAAAEALEEYEKRKKVKKQKYN